METTRIDWGYIGIVEKKRQTTRRIAAKERSQSMGVGIVALHRGRVTDREMLSRRRFTFR